MFISPFSFLLLENPNLLKVATVHEFGHYEHADFGNRSVCFRPSKRCIAVARLRVSATAELEPAAARIALSHDVSEASLLYAY